MKWLLLLLSLYLVYYTSHYAIYVWKDGYRFATFMIGLLILSLVILPIWLFIRV